MPRIVPVIDISQLERDEPTRQAFLRSGICVRRRAMSVSSYLAGHGIPEDQIDRVFAVSR